MNKLSITDDAISHLVNEVQRDITVQIINLKKMKTTSRLSCELSDGYYKIRAYITEEKINENNNLAFIQITSYGLLQQNDKPVGIVVHNCRLIDIYTEILGEPVDYIKQHNKANKQNKVLISEEKLRSFIEKNRHHASVKKQNGNANSFETIKASGPSTASKNAIERLYTPDKRIEIQERPITQDFKDYQKISDLYPDFPNWQIVVRLVKKNYRQFVSGKGKNTKVLNLEFIDHTGMKITGALFGQTAKEIFNSLKQDGIYEVSKGQIKQDQYTQNKGKNYSKYTLMFTRQSEFRPCQNTQLVPHYESNLKNLMFISDNRNIGEQYDAVGILLHISEQVQIPKDNKTLHKQAIQICDPVNELVMEAVIWNRHLNLSQSMLGKTIGLFGFRLNQYNQKLSLNSSYQSEVKLIDNHEYRKYQGQVEKNKMEILSDRKERVVEIEQPCKNLKELQNETYYLTEGRQIKSTLTLILTFISHKKWSYESCPYCRKSAEANNRCGSCEKYIEQTIPRYKLNVELSDYCGSIWATGFEELGAKLFSDQTDGIKGIKKLDENDRHRLFEKKQFQQFTIKLSTKNDRDGGIKHTINRIYDCNYMNKIQNNIERIKKHM